MFINWSKSFAFNLQSQINFVRVTMWSRLQTVSRLDLLNFLLCRLLKSSYLNALCTTTMSPCSVELNNESFSWVAISDRSVSSRHHIRSKLTEVTYLYIKLTQLTKHIDNTVCKQNYLNTQNVIWVHTTIYNINLVQIKIHHIFNMFISFAVRLETFLSNFYS